MLMSRRTLTLMQAIIILNIITKIIMLMVMRLGIEKTVQDPPP